MPASTPADSSSAASMAVIKGGMSPACRAADAGARYRGGGPPLGGYRLAALRATAVTAVGDPGQRQVHARQPAAGPLQQRRDLRSLERDRRPFRVVLVIGAD